MEAWERPIDILAEGAETHQGRLETDIHDTVICASGLAGKAECLEQVANLRRGSVAPVGFGAAAEWAGDSAELRI
jgi:hypothetical protein